MRWRLLSILIIIFVSRVSGQTNTMHYFVEYQDDSKLLKVKQTMKLHRESPDSLLYLYAWANAYKDKTTQLSNIKINQRKDDLYFADLEERGWIENIHFFIKNSKDTYTKAVSTFVDNEMIEVEVPKNKMIELSVDYLIHLPHKKFTGYGIGDDASLLLKYFFLQPAIQEKGEILEQNFQDFEALSINKANHYLTIKVPDNFQVITDLQRKDLNEYEGLERDFFQISVQKKENTSTFQTPYGTVIFDRTFPDSEKVLIQKILIEQLKYLTEKLGRLYAPIFISGKTYRNNTFQGVQDVEIPVINKKYQIFETQDRIALEMIAQLTEAYMERSVAVNMLNEHWLRNGLAHYYMMEYIANRSPDLKLSGKITKDIHLGNWYPLNFFEASKIKMKDRSQWLYRLQLQSNFDQPINTPFDELSNSNQKIVSEIKAGMALQYLATYLGKNDFDKVLKKWIHQSSPLTVDNFKMLLESHSEKDLSWFFDEMIKSKGWYDIAIKKVIETEINARAKIKYKGDFFIPFTIKTTTENDTIQRWVMPNSKKVDIEFPKNNYEQIAINQGLAMPDKKPENDVIFPQRWLRNRLKIGLITDMPSNELNQIFVLPSVGWNNYDKLKIGLALSNKTILTQPWEYKIEPQYSTGEGSLTGGARLNRNIYPENTWFRRIRLTAGAGYGHYQQGLAYQNIGLGVVTSFRKIARSSRNRDAYLFYQQINREVDSLATQQQKEIKDYGLLNIGYSYWNTHVIHERRGLLNFQVSNDFSKIFGEYYYRWKIAKNKRLGVRIFGGAFISHDLDFTEYFDFGLDRISDYTFSYPLLGRSENQGWMSQQYVMAEGGFKSNFFKKSNQLMLTTNIEIPIYKIIDAYADAGYIKNKKQKGEFLYDSGIRVRFIPDFLELYFPLQSSLGFEPTLGAYHQRIRFMLNLDLGKLMRYWRRGKN